MSQESNSTGGIGDKKRPRVTSVRIKSNIGGENYYDVIFYTKETCEDSASSLEKISGIFITGSNIPNITSDFTTPWIMGFKCSDDSESFYSRVYDSDVPLYTYLTIISETDKYVDVAIHYPIGVQNGLDKFTDVFRKKELLK